MLTRETIATRRALLVKEQQDVLARYNAYVGAIEDCDHWLRELDREEAKAVAAPAPAAPAKKPARKRS